MTMEASGNHARKQKACCVAVRARSPLAVTAEVVVGGRTPAARHQGAGTRGHAELARPAGVVQVEPNALRRRLGGAVAKGGSDLLDDPLESPLRADSREVL